VKGNKRNKLQGWLWDEQLAGETKGKNNKYMNGEIPVSSESKKKTGTPSRTKVCRRSRGKKEFSISRVWKGEREWASL